MEKLSCVFCSGSDAYPRGIHLYNKWMCLHCWTEIVQISKNVIIK